MRGLWLQDRQLRLREDLPIPVPGPGEALVRVRLAGICTTDLELRQGYYPFAGIPGHEFVGEITAAPDQPERRGERVVGEINLPCGHCPPCQAGRGNHCERRRVLGIKDHDGAFAEYLVLPLANLNAVPDTIPDEAAVFCEPLAAALRIPEQRPIRVGEGVLVVGAGDLGRGVPGSEERGQEGGGEAPSQCAETERVFGEPVPTSHRGVSQENTERTAEVLGFEPRPGAAVPVQPAQGRKSVAEEPGRGHGSGQR